MLVGLKTAQSNEKGMTDTEIFVFSLNLFQLNFV